MVYVFYLGLWFYPCIIFYTSQKPCNFNRNNAAQSYWTSHQQWLPRMEPSLRVSLHTIDISPPAWATPTLSWPASDTCRCTRSARSTTTGTCRWHLAFSPSITQTLAPRLRRHQQRCPCRPVRQHALLSHVQQRGDKEEQPRRVCPPTPGEVPCPQPGILHRYQQSTRGRPTCSQDTAPCRG